MSLSNLKTLHHTRDLKAKLDLLFNFLGDALSRGVDEFAASNGYCCFSKGDDKSLCNSLMWSHYSDGLRGFCLSFDRRKLLDSFASLNKDSDPVLFPVEYSDAVPILNIFDYLRTLLTRDGGGSSSFDFASTVCSAKAKSWAYENEWRAVSANQGLHCVLQPIVDAISG